MKLMVYDVDSATTKEFIGKCETSIGKVMGAPRQTFLADLMDDKHKESRGKIIVRLDGVNQTNDEVRLKIRATL